MYYIDEYMEVDDGVYELTFPKRRRWFNYDGNIRISRLFFDINLIDNIYDINSNPLIYDNPKITSSGTINFIMEFNKNE